MKTFKEFLEDILAEAPLPPPGGLPGGGLGSPAGLPGGPPGGGLPPMGGGLPPPPMGGVGGGLPPLGGSPGPQQQQQQVTKIDSPDIWNLLEKLLVGDDPKEKEQKK